MRPVPSDGARPLDPDPAPVLAGTVSEAKAPLAAVGGLTGAVAGISVVADVGAGALVFCLGLDGVGRMAVVGAAGGLFGVGVGAGVGVATGSGVARAVSAGMAVEVADDARVRSRASSESKVSACLASPRQANSTAVPASTTPREVREVHTERIH